MTTSASPVLCTACMGTLSVVGLSATIAFSNAPVWCAPELDELWDSPPLRQGNTVIAGVAGRLARTMLDDEHTVSIPMVFTGLYAYTAPSTPVAPSGQQAALQANLDYFRAQLIDVSAAAGSVYTATFTKPSGATVSGPVQMGPMRVKIGPGVHARAVVGMTIPAGRLV